MALTNASKFLILFSIDRLFYIINFSRYSNIYLCVLDFNLLGSKSKETTDKNEEQGIHNHYPTQIFYHVL